MPESAESRQTTFKCPVCGSPATVNLDWRTEGEAPHADIGGYECPSGCEVDDEAIRNIIGTQ